jgi:hypothetical protein
MQEQNSNQFQSNKPLALPRPESLSRESSQRIFQEKSLSWKILWATPRPPKQRSDVQPCRRGGADPGDPARLRQAKPLATDFETGQQGYRRLDCPMSHDDRGLV